MYSRGPQTFSTGGYCTIGHCSPLGLRLYILYSVSGFSGRLYSRQVEFHSWGTAARSFGAIDVYICRQAAQSYVSQHIEIQRHQNGCCCTLCGQESCQRSPWRKGTLWHVCNTKCQSWGCSIRAETHRIGPLIISVSKKGNIKRHLLTNVWKY